MGDIRQAWVKPTSRAAVARMVKRYHSKNLKYKRPARCGVVLSYPNGLSVDGEASGLAKKVEIN